MKHAVLFALFLPVFSVEIHGQQFTEEGAQVVTFFKVFPDREGHQYFPKGRESYYTYYLAAMKEPSIYRPLPDGVEYIYRLTILPSFSDRMAITISKKEGRHELRATQLKCDDAHEAVRIVHDETRILDQDLSGPLVKLLSHEDLWVEFTGLEEAVMDSEMDGVAFVFEKRTKKGYEMIDPRSPSSVVRYQEGDPNFSRKDFRIFGRVADRLMKESGLPVESDSAERK